MGTAGADRSVEEGYAAARACALMQLAVLRRHLGSLDAVKSMVDVNGYVNAVAGFPDSPRVINGASDLFIEIFGEAGRHVRAAIGVSRFAAQRAGGTANDRGDLRELMAEHSSFRTAHALALEPRASSAPAHCVPATPCIWNASIQAARKCIPAWPSPNT